MATNLQIDQELGETAQAVKDEDGNETPLTLSTSTVGIGTQNPTQALDLGGQNKNIKFHYAHIGETGSGAATVIANKARVSETEPNRVDYSHSNDDGVSAIELLYTAGISFFTKPIDANNPTVEGDQFFSFTDRTHERVRISPAGNVGIGSSNPVTKLHVNGQSLWLTGGNGGPLGDSAGKGLRLYFNEEEDYAAIWAYAYGSGPRNIILAQDSVGGNVGIGTTTPSEKLEVHGNITETGDVILTGADCAEDFDVEEGQILEPGTVMVIGDEDRLHQSKEAYDKRVAGVLSGAGDCKPGIILGKERSNNKRLPLALTGKVYCRVDAQYSPIGVGDLLTTSPTLGHAMKAADPLKAFGAVIGKALRPLTEGQGLIPILIALH